MEQLKFLVGEELGPDTMLVVPRGPAMEFMKRHCRHIRPGAILDATEEEMEALKEIRVVRVTVVRGEVAEEEERHG